jgi:hypothetical protein
VQAGNYSVGGSSNRGSRALRRMMECMVACFPNGKSHSAQGLDCALYATVSVILDKDFLIPTKGQLEFIQNTNDNVVRMLMYEQLIAPFQNMVNQKCPIETGELLGEANTSQPGGRGHSQGSYGTTS